jgi:geranylgeranyl reductase family protein
MSLTANKFDVVVAGGGPAGSAAAFTLAAQGFRVAVVDKYSFPRDKLCGGLLTLRAQKIFREVFHADWSPVIQRTARGAKFFHRSSLLNSVNDYSDISFTCRCEFDAFVLNLAIQRGVTLFENRTVKSFDAANSTISLANGSILAYDFLIGADGVNSAIARSIFGTPFNPQTIGFGLELEVPLGRSVPQIPDPEIYFGLIDWGYGWVFPKRDSLTAGVGGSLRKNPQLMDSFKNFLRQRFGEIPAGKIKGHHIPFGDFRRVPGRGNILLCGDAAGLVEPITGEGIAFAMQSGYLAAESVREASAVGNPSAAISFYQPRYETIAASFRHANRLRHFLFPRAAQNLFSKILPRTSSIPRRHLDLMADEITYADYGKFLLRKAVSTPLRLFIARPRAAFKTPGSAATANAPSATSPPHPFAETPPPPVSRTGLNDSSPADASLHAR